MNSLKNLKDLAGQKVLLRVDFNVPLEKDKKGRTIVADHSKILASLSTIKFLLDHKAKIILITHLGRPRGKVVNSLRLEPVVKELKKLLQKYRKDIGYWNDWNFENIKNIVNEMGEGEILVLENLRFQKEEESNNAKFAKSLAGLARIYINDAFAVCHRKVASIVAIARYLPSYQGLLLEKEIEALNKVVKHPKKPMVVMMGGAKVATKIGMINNLLKKSNQILLGGGLANTFLKAKRYEVGKSLFDKDGIKFAKKLLKSKKLILPIDIVVAKNKNGKPTVKEVRKVSKNDMILDIGPETIKLFAGFIHNANTLVWNGPLGYYENKIFSHGSIALGRLIAARSSGRAYGVVGGGETLDVLEDTKMAKFIDHVSTGGGAMLEFLEGKSLPGIKALEK